MELLFSLKTGSVPLYVPGFGLGHSASALTLGQPYHPLPYLSWMMPGYWEGNAIEWNSFYKFLSLGIAQLALFWFLLNIRVNKLFSFLLSFITVYNLRLLELFRHGAPMEAYTGHLMLCAVIGCYYLRPTRWKGPLSLIALTYVLVCSGHPEEMYYGFAATGFFTVIAPFYISEMVAGTKIDFRSAMVFWVKIGSFLCLGVLLSSAYVLPFYFDFVSDNVQRVVQDYSFAVMKQDTLVGTLNNFFLPLRSRAMEAFGGSSIILVAFLLPVLGFCKVKIPRNIWAVWILLVLVFLHMQGIRTPVHRVAWEYLPFAASIRDPGRISIVMPFFIMLLLAWALNADAVWLRVRNSEIKIRPVAVLACASLLLTVFYYALLGAAYNDVFSLGSFNELFSEPVGHINFMSSFWLEFLISILGLSSLACLAFYAFSSERPGRLGVLLVVLMLMQVGIVTKSRSVIWTEKKYDAPTIEEVREQKRAKLDYRYYQGAGMYSSIVVTHLERSFMEPFLSKIYTDVIPVNDRNDAYEKMDRGFQPHQIYVEGFSPEKARAITEKARHMKEGDVRLVYSSFNRLKFQVNSEKPAMFGLSYPFTGKWRAWVNGEEAQTYLANGATHAIEIPEGESSIEFRYWSSTSFLGMAISCASFALIGCFACFRGMNGLQRVVGMFIVVLLSAGILALWYGSLYSGDNLETQYGWTYTPPHAKSNLAYGKKNWLSYCTIFTSWIAREHELNRGRYIDGDSSLNSGFTTRLCESPAWFLDLNRLEYIETIKMYESDQDSPINVRPLTVSTSEDGNEWNVVAIIHQDSHQRPINVFFDKPEAARFIKVEATGKCKLSFDEIEVYGPVNSELGGLN